MVIFLSLESSGASGNKNGNFSLFLYVDPCFFFFSDESVVTQWVSEGKTTSSSALPYREKLHERHNNHRLVRRGT